MGLAHHGGSQYSPPKADRLYIRRSQGNGLKYMIFKGKPPRNGNRWNIGSFGLQLFAHLIGQTLQLYGWDAPFVHHAPGTHPRASARAVYGQKIDLGIGRILDRPGKISRPICPCLQSNVFGAQAPQVLN